MAKSTKNNGKGGGHVTFDESTKGGLPMIKQTNNNQAW